MSNASIIFFCVSRSINYTSIYIHSTSSHFTFSKHLLHLAQRINFEKQIKNEFQNSFSIPIPPAILERAQYEKKLVQSIRRQLKKDRLILRRTADQNNVYYLGQIDEFEHHAHEYMQKTTSYERIQIDDQNNSFDEQLAEIIKSIDSIIENLHQIKRIKKDRLAKIRVKKSKVELPYLYFLPEPPQASEFFFEICFIYTS